MILYTLSPLSEHLLQPDTAQNDIPTVTCSLSGGYLQGIRTEQGFRITRIDSTDPTVYLRKENDIGTLRSDIRSFR